MDNFRRRLLSQDADPKPYVDLGLPSGLLWCDHNVGASKPEEEGFFFSWGNVTPGTSGFDQTTYNSTSGHNLTGDIAVGDAYDMARANMGAPWRLPTRLEFQELYDNCTNAWVTQNGVKGRRFTSNINGNSIFFPAAGRYRGSSHLDVGSYGSYWSSSFCSETSAYYLLFNSSAVSHQYGNGRFFGFSVRAVQ